MHLEALLIPILLQDAKSRADHYCWELAEIFSHKATNGEPHTCIEDMLKTINTILVKTLTTAVQTIGFVEGFSNKPAEGGYRFKMNTRPWPGKDNSFVQMNLRHDMAV